MLALTAVEKIEDEGEGRGEERLYGHNGVDFLADIKVLFTEVFRFLDRLQDPWRSGAAIVGY